MIPFISLAIDQTLENLKKNNYNGQKIIDDIENISVEIVGRLFFGE